MPTVGPNFFNLSAAPVNSPPSNWINPGDAAGAPDGNLANFSCSFTNGYYLWFTQWQGLQYLPPVVNLNSVLIEIYGYIDPAASTAGTDFNSSFLYNNAFATSSVVGTVGLTTTASWKPLIRVSGASFSYNGPVDSTFGVAISFRYDTGGFGSAPLYIDSARMTVAYNDNFYDPGYAFARNRRRFMAKRNGQRKVICEQIKPRMTRRKAA